MDGYEDVNTFLNVKDKCVAVHICAVCITESDLTYFSRFISNAHAVVKL